jgi:hypothetical protein
MWTAAHSFSISMQIIIAFRATQLSSNCSRNINIFMIAEGGAPDIPIRLCMVMDWRFGHPEYTAKNKIISKKDYLILTPCEF